jgi:hypothetical protein
MRTREQIEEQLRSQNPTTTDESGTVRLPGDDYYETIMTRWVDATEAQEIADAAIADRKVWPSSGAFWAEFTQAEKVAIVTSTIPDIKVLHADLQVWPGEVWSTDPKVQEGLSGLQLVTILTAERKAAILAK